MLYVTLGLVILVESVQTVLAVVLLAILALAFGLHLLQGSPNLVLLVYGAGVLFVRVHGVSGYHWT